MGPDGQIIKQHKEFTEKQKQIKNIIKSCRSNSSQQFEAFSKMKDIIKSTSDVENAIMKLRENLNTQDEQLTKDGKMTNYMKQQPTLFDEVLSENLYHENSYKSNFSDPSAVQEFKDETIKIQIQTNKLGKRKLWKPDKNMGRSLKILH